MTDLAPPKASERDILQYERVCPRCGDLKPITDYPRNRSRPDGRSAYCRPCHNQVGREYRATEHGHDAVAASRRRSYERRKARFDAAVAALPIEDRERLGLA